MQDDTPHVVSNDKTPPLMQESYILSEGYGLQPNKVAFDNRLSFGARVLYGYLNALSAATGSCFPKNKHLADKFNVSTRQINNLLKELLDLEYAYTMFADESTGTGKRTIILYARGGMKNTSRGVEENFYSDRNSATDLTETITNTNNKTNKYTDTELSDLDRLHTLWTIKHKIPPHKLTDASDEEKRALLESYKTKYRLTDKRKATIIARLRDAGYDMIAKAIINVSKSDWHMGENPDGKKYNELAEFICRNYEQVEKWANMEDES